VHKLKYRGSFDDALRGNVPLSNRLMTAEQRRITS